jgi:hypothetical protein
MSDANLLNVGLELPVFNQNKGNIRMAKALVSSYETDYLQKKNAGAE